MKMFSILSVKMQNSKQMKKQFSIAEIIFTMFILSAIGFTKQSSVNNILTAVSQDITSIWTYKNSYSSIKSLLLDEQSLEAGFAVDGNKTKEAIRRMLQSAINGKNVNVFVLGGSSTIGADLGKNNLKLTYHYALADWWNSTIGLATGSFMHRTVIAVGGVGTTYFGHCWQEYVDEKMAFDYVTWEFAINDPDSLQYDKAVERFVRSVLSMSSSPGLTFVNFASKSKVAAGSGNNCKRHEDDAKIVDSMARHYSSTSIRWERALCSYKNGELKKKLNKLFTKNHPKAIGHAQVAYMLIHYFKQIILNSLTTFNKSKRSVRFLVPYSPGTVFETTNGFYNSVEARSNLPAPVFMSKDESKSASKCFTSVSPGPSNPPKHKLEDLRVLQNNGFTILDEGPWDSVPEQRFDSTGGYIAKSHGPSLKLQFNVLHANPNLPWSKILVTVRNKYFGGKVKFVLNEGTSNEKIVYADTSEKKKAGTNSIELGMVAQGTQTLSIYAETGGCNLCAVIID